MKVTKALKAKLEDIFNAQQYVVRYEKGNFHSGYCLLESKNVVVINKFFPLESKVNALMEILRKIELDNSLLDRNQLKLVNQLKQTELQF